MASEPDLRFIVSIRRDVDALPHERGSVEEARSGERYYFTHLRELPTLLRACIERMPRRDVGEERE
jgi:hypothetical protein